MKQPMSKVQLVSPFERACWDNNIEKVRELLPSATDMDLFEGVDAAIAESHVDIINFLLSTGRKLPNLLDVACYNDNLSMIKLFIDRYELEEASLINVSAQTLEFLLTSMKEGKVIPKDYVETVVFWLERKPDKYKPICELLFKDRRAQFDYDTLATAINAHNEELACRMLDHSNFIYNNHGHYYSDFHRMMKYNMRDLAYKLVSIGKFDVGLCDDEFDQDQLYNWARHRCYNDIVDIIEQNYPNRKKWT